MEEDAGARRARPPSGPAATPSGVNIGLQGSADQVKTIQLYKGTEVQLPILSMQGNEALTLEFDVMEDRGRTLSIYFYHADRTWQRDLVPAEYLTSFNRDDLFDYTPSRGTQIRYTHYRYTFPNNSIGFRISGNYILRVTEQGREEEVLFEWPFFVTESAAALELAFDNVLVGGQQGPFTQPTAVFRPPQELTGNVFDFDVCFVRNGRYEAVRCSDRPSLTQQPNLVFFLQPERSFEPQSADYVVDMANLRIGGSLAEVDRSVTPYAVVLEPDYARFPSTSADPLLNGQTVVSAAVRDVGNPDIDAEYVQVRFSFVPPNEQALRGGLMLTGSFNGWSFDLANRLSWVSALGRYEGELLLKQGQYEYRYASRDARVRRQLSTNLPRSDNLFTAFVYFSDTRLNTDRLLAAEGAMAR